MLCIICWFRLLCCSYLLGRQVVADSTIEGYVAALRRGCRLLERTYGAVYKLRNRF